MKSHSLAHALRTLADILEQGPNTELSNLEVLNKGQFLSSEQIAVNLSTLAALSKIKKPQWIEFINNYQFDIQITTRDSSRNILGKLLTYLDKHPEAVNLIKKRSLSSKSGSNALSKAFDILLEDL